jgi:hypothetical protein
MRLVGAIKQPRSSGEQDFKIGVELSESEWEFLNRPEGILTLPEAYFIFKCKRGWPALLMDATFATSRESLSSLAHTIAHLNG